ncbi:hypothetical protein LEP1GSC166_4064 [Leptospira kirschneri]|nr:hypothetical protein LEP1GSC166_4064 [Leptospira kirschneri]
MLNFPASISFALYRIYIKYSFFVVWVCKSSHVLLLRKNRIYYIELRLVSNLEQETMTI